MLELLLNSQRPIDVGTIDTIRIQVINTGHRKIAEVQILNDLGVSIKNLPGVVCSSSDRYGHPNYSDEGPIDGVWNVQANGSAWCSTSRAVNPWWQITFPYPVSVSYLSAINMSAGINNDTINCEWDSANIYFGLDGTLQLVKEVRGLNTTIRSFKQLYPWARHKGQG